MVVLVLLLAGVVVWAWVERVPLVNALLARLGGDTRMQVTSLEWQDGVLHVRELSAQNVSTNQRLGEAGHIEWRPTWKQLWERNLGSVKVEGGSVDAALALFATQGEKDPATGKPLPWRLDSLDLASTKIVLRDDKGEPLLSVTVQGNMRGGSSAISFESSSVDAADVAWQGKSISSRFHLDAVMEGDHIKIRKGSLMNGHFDLAWAKGFLPLLRGGVDLEWEGRDMVLSRAGVLAGGTHVLRLKNLLIQPQTESGVVKVEAVELQASQDANGRWEVKSGVMQKPEVAWTQDLEDMLMPARAEQPGTATTPAKPWKVAVGTVAMKEGSVTLAPTKRSPLAGSFKWSGAFQQLEISKEGVRSAAPQKLELADVSLRWGRLEKEVKLAPFFEAKTIALEAVPDRLLDTWQVDSLVMNAPRVELKPENGPWFHKTPAEPAPTPVAAAKTKPPFWQRLQFGNVTLTDASYTMAMELTQRLEADAKFNLTTEGGKQHLRIAQARILTPEQADLPVITLEKVEAVALWPAMWQLHRLDSLKLGGGQVEAGNALMTVFGGGKGKVVEKKMEAAAARWMTGTLEVTTLGVTILDIAPGLPPVRFDVNLTAKETPLDLNGLAENVEPQRIVLTRLRIPSPHEPLRTVAEMDTIHVNYTLDGLLNRRIDRVQIIAPLLYVGEDLFWYVENYRKYMKGETPMADASAGPPRPLKASAPSWKVDTLAVNDGRLLLAPKGVPLAGFNRPFPFSFTSKLESGQLDATFDIPSDDYTLPQLKLEFRGMKGHVQFNLPMRDRNNNLTETFTVEQLRWKQLHLEKAHLSVTYDANGIYGQFGGQAYGGYVNGAFDVYLDEVYTWDGWVSGVNVALGPVTRALFPTYVVLEGGVACKVIATGNMHELYQGDVEFTNRTSGRFSIESLNKLIKELPPVLKGDVSQQIRRIGLETLRNFEYDAIDGQARFYGREGRGHLRFTGPLGSRNIDINVYDHRWKAEPRQSQTAEAVEP